MTATECAKRPMPFGSVRLGDPAYSADFSRKVRSSLAFATMLIAIACAADSRSPASPSPPPDGEPAASTVTVDTLQRFQVMTGWEASTQAGQLEADFSQWETPLFDQAVNELGINRLRLQVRPGSENSTEYFTPTITERDCSRWTTTNDNSDPQVINPAGFHFGEVDSQVEKVILPMKQRLEARGEKLFVNLMYVGFIGKCNTTYVHADPAEYAEFILATFLHLRDSYGWVPDALEIVLEADNTAFWSNGTVIGRAIAATAARLSQAGFHPLYIAPAAARIANAIAYSTAMFAVPGVNGVLGQMSYHRYGETTTDQLFSLSQIAATHGATTAMLEHIGSGVEDLYKDLTIARVSAWQEFTLASPSAGDDGGKYYMIVNNKPVIGDRSRYLRQYFHYVRIGARRVGAVSNNSDVRPVAFQNTNGRLAVVMHVDREGTIDVRGLRPGKYGASISTKTSTGAELGEKTVGTDGSLRLTAPSVGVLTAYQK